MSDDLEDMYQRRAERVYRESLKRTPANSRHLSSDQVQALRAEYANGVSVPDLARKYERSEHTVRGIVTGRTRVSG